ncbi:MAG: hypothetical protein Q8L48_20660 [Archangium sp.]|nr:hypothetical protein [Archangium sp.]
MDFPRSIRDKAPVTPTPPRTSSHEHHDLFKSLGLNVELHPEASAELPAVVTQLIAWYSDEARAAEAKVFSLTGHQKPPREVLTKWVGRALPPDAEGDALITYAADALYIAGDHGASASSPQLLGVEAGDAALYLLRSHGQRKQVRGDGWLPATLYSPDTEAALGGIFRFEGCTRAFSEHASGCEDCLSALEAWDFEHGLPEGFEKFRRVPVRAARRAPVDEGEPEEGVAIFIPRPPEQPDKPKAWWKFW